MKKFPNGIIAYYPRTSQKIISVLMVMVGVALAGSLCDGKDGSLWIIAIVMLIGGGFLVWDSFFQAVFRMCPDKLEWYSRLFVFYRKNVLPWDKISEFYLNEEYVKRYRGWTLEKVLILRIKDNPEKSIKIVRFFYSLSEQDRESLLNELRRHGIPQGSDRKDEYA